MSKEIGIFLCNKSGDEIIKIIYFPQTSKIDHIYFITDVIIFFQNFFYQKIKSLLRTQFSFCSDSQLLNFNLLIIETFLIL